MEETMKYVLQILLYLLLCCVMGLLFSLPIMWIWNWLMPVIFGLCKITWLQAWCLGILARLLFGTSSTSNAD